MDEIKYDVIIIGGGPAGLSAALALGRARRKIILVDEGHPRNEVESQVGGFLTQDGTPPFEMRKIATEQILKYPATEIQKGVIKLIELADNEFHTTLTDGTKINSRKILLSPGLVMDIPDIPGYKENWGPNIFHCPFCNGWEHQDQRVAVIVNKEKYLKKGTFLSCWTKNLTFVISDKIEIDSEFQRQIDLIKGKVMQGEVKSIKSQNGKLEGIHLTNEEFIECESIFHGPEESLPIFVKDLRLKLTKYGLIEINNKYQTSIQGIFAAGDISNPMSQGIIAAANGHYAGMNIHRNLYDEDHDVPEKYRGF